MNEWQIFNLKKIVAILLIHFLQFSLFNPRLWLQIASITFFNYMHSLNTPLAIQNNWFRSCFNINLTFLWLLFPHKSRQLAKMICKKNCHCLLKSQKTSFFSFYAKSFDLKSFVFCTTSSGAQKAKVTVKNANLGIIKCFGWHWGFHF